MPRMVNRSLWLLAVAMVYIVAQFIWWAVLLLRREAEIARLTADSGVGGNASGASSRTWMVLGEAGVFFLLLGIVLTLAFMAIRRDLRLAALQRNFLLAITHELRTPVASIKLQLQTLSRKGLSDADASRIRAAAVAEADRLAALTDKVLVATSQGDSEIPLRKEQLDAVALVRETIERAQQRDSGAHSWDADLPAGLPAHADPQALRSIVENLLENAIKYAPSGTTIRVSVRDSSSDWQLEVADEGPGIPESERNGVFERFYRMGNEETRSHPGTGLGLYVVRRLVQRHGGHVSIRDTVPHGATFAATFPKTLK
ncbi:MAG TPA: HAMP domain-containing sensor histidine kinase [Flavobacteriales bacterium]|nr:HAMP domain-containing sensor histidine kinase [Flavobacteriales bacterium]